MRFFLVFLLYTGGQNLLSFYLRIGSVPILCGHIDFGKRIGERNHRKRLVYIANMKFNFAFCLYYKNGGFLGFVDDKRYMKPVRIIFGGLLCGVISTAHADIASVQYVQSIISSLDIPSAQSDWNQTDSTADDFIKNKPTIPTTAAEVGAVPTSRTVNGNALSADVTLDGADIAVTGYTKPASTSAIAASE